MSHTARASINFTIVSFILTDFPIQIPPLPQRYVLTISVIATFIRVTAWHSFVRLQTRHRQTTQTFPSPPLNPRAAIVDVSSLDGRENGIQANSRSFAGDVAGHGPRCGQSRCIIRTRVFRRCHYASSPWRLLDEREFAAATVAVCTRENCGPLPADLCNRISRRFSSSLKNSSFKRHWSPVRNIESERSAICISICISNMIIDCFLKVCSSHESKRCWIDRGY